MKQEIQDIQISNFEDVKRLLEPFGYTQSSHFYKTVAIFKKLNTIKGHISLLNSGRMKLSAWYKALYIWLYQCEVQHQENTQLRVELSNSTHELIKPGSLKAFEAKKLISQEDGFEKIRAMFVEPYDLKFFRKNSDMKETSSWYNEFTGDNYTTKLSMVGYSSVNMFLNWVELRKEYVRLDKIRQEQNEKAPA